ncbi:motility associated factor glycosyltransferase family protein [Sediminispirochaeta smaragdinae]|uniref:6-hydroxymethylpterin diphosphokinase MptE-like domain-containing protein n=1 Tax=Sediminispirochaeta smaragdinae (strain DSM 11293 / JCM 15392 / SEBR 4228) TaxID=573413 RepID=E1R1B9_SEDSS|nr:6-hydroxymethylpterin diphosphokinase MptE-like protein [Sediminispirochaeta smaragdinae]ADK81060.1 protein of unknown function DUF115 [Sediminispirochaeta smaragdinae DSM 11293]
MNQSALRLFRSKNGALTAQIENYLIHSKYDPLREAYQFAERLAPCSLFSWIIIIGDLFAYLATAIHEKFPQAHIISLSPERGLVQSSFSLDEMIQKGVYRWEDKNLATLQLFLDDCIPDHAVQDLRVLHWNPVLRAYPGWSKEVIRVITERADLLSANYTTSRVFARRWLKNGLAHLAFDYMQGPLHMITSIHGPTIVAASGPGLSEFFPLLARYRDFYFLCALPSSLKALHEAGLSPDLIMHADAGYWATLHLHNLSHLHEEKQKPILFSSLTSAPFHQRQEKNERYVHGMFIEEDSPFAIESPSLIHLPARGTVAANAFDLLNQIATGPIFFAGLDLAASDLRFHVKPHTFDSRITSGTYRYEPELHRRFIRSLEQGFSGSGLRKSSNALSLYARFFSNRTDVKGISRITSSCSISLPGDKEITFLERFLAHEVSGQRSIVYKTKTIDLDIIRTTVLNNFQNRLNTMKQLQDQELRTLLSLAPSKRSIEEHRLINLFTMIDCDLHDVSKARIRKAIEPIEEMIEHVKKHHP